MKPNRKLGERQRREKGKATKARRQARRDRLDARMRDEFRVLRFWRT